MWMQTTSEIAGISYLMETSVPAPGILDPYRSRDCISLAVRVFYRDHRADTVSGAIERLEKFADDVRLDGSLAIRLRPASAPGWRQLALDRRAARAAAAAPRGDATRAPATRAPTLALAGPTRWDGPDGLAAEIRHPSLRAPYELWMKTGGEWKLQPSGTWLRDGVELRYAAGSIGVLAAANQEIERQPLPVARDRVRGDLRRAARSRTARSCSR